MSKCIFIVLLVSLVSCASSSTYQALKEANKDDAKVLRVGARLQTTVKYSKKMLDKCYVNTFSPTYGNKYTLKEVSDSKNIGLVLSLSPLIGSVKVIAYLEFSGSGKKTNIKIYGYGMNGKEIKKMLKTKQCPFM